MTYGEIVERFHRIFEGKHEELLSESGELRYPDSDRDAFEYVGTGFVSRDMDPFHPSRGVY